MVVQVEAESGWVRHRGIRQHDVEVLNMAIRVWDRGIQSSGSSAPDDDCTGFGRLIGRCEKAVHATSSNEWLRAGGIMMYDGMTLV